MMLLDQRPPGYSSLHISYRSLVVRVSTVKHRTSVRHDVARPAHSGYSVRHISYRSLVVRISTVKQKKSVRHDVAGIDASVSCTARQAH